MGLRTESSNLLSVLDELNTDTLSDGGVGLLGFDTDFLENYSLGVGGATEGRRLEGSTESALFVSEISPLLLLAVQTELSGRVETTRLSFTHDCYCRGVARSAEDRGCFIWQLK